MVVAYEPIGFCPRCGYRVDPGRCPECGLVVVQPLRRPPRSLRSRLLRIGALLTVLAALVTGGYFAFPWLARAYWPTGHLCQLAGGTGKWSVWARGILDYRLTKRMNEEHAAFEARTAALDSELENLGAPADGPGTATTPAWAGSYEWRGADNFAGLTLAPHSGFTFLWSSCPDGTYENHGTIAEVNGEYVKLAPVIDLRLPHALRMSGEYVPVAWGAWRLMIPTEEMVRFCNDVREDPGFAPYNGYLSNWAYEDPPSDTLPRVTVRWLPYLSPPDVIAVVTAVSVEPLDARGLECHLRLTLNKGSANGILPGMRLFGDSRDFRKVEVHSTTESAATVIDHFYESLSIPYQKPAPGDTYTTKAPARTD